MADDLVVAVQVQGRALLHAGEVAGVQGLEAHHQARAAGLEHQLHEGRVLGEAHIRLAQPADLQGLDGPEQGGGLLAISDDVVVHEEDQLAAVSLELGDHLGHGAGGVPLGVDVARGAVLAAVGATPAELGQAHRQVGLALEDAPVGAHRLQARAWSQLPQVAPPELPPRGVVHKLGPDRLGIARDHRVGVGRGLVGDHGGVVATQHHGHAAGPEGVGDLVGPPRRVDLGVDAHQIPGLVVGQRLEAVIDERHLVARRCDAGEHGEGQGLHAPAVVVGLAPDQAHVGLDEEDPHGVAPPPSTTSPCPSCSERLRPMSLRETRLATRYSSAR
jgi:hypothetical protein